MRWLGAVVLVTTATAGAVSGPLVASSEEVLALRWGPAAEVYYLGRLGDVPLLCGHGARNAGAEILAEGGGRRYYRVEGASPARLAPFGEVLYERGGEVLLARQYGFVYDRPMRELAAPWRELVPVNVARLRRAGPPRLESAAADGRLQYLLSRVKTEEVRRDLDGLTAFPTRYSFSPYRIEAADWLHDRLTSYGLAPRYETFITAHDFDACFFLPGTERGWVVGASGLILRTDDGGGRWTIQESGTEEELVDVFFVNASRGWIVGANGTVLRTTDGGASWRSLPRPTDRHLTGVHFVSGAEGWTCGTAGIILHTTDGGFSWETQPSNIADTLFELQFLDALNGYAVGWHGEVRSTSDGGATWVRRRTPFSDPQTPAEVVELTGLSFVSPLEGWVVGNHYDVILHTDDGGQSWEVQRYDVDAGEYLGAVHFFDRTTGVAVGGEEGAVLRTTDGGATWRKSDAPADFPLTGLSFASRAQGWTCGYGSCLDVTADGGQSWRSLRDNLPPELGWDNVVCDVRGTVEPGAQYLVVAHYDSISDRPLELAPGADDDASGVVAALAVARTLAEAQLERTVRVVLFAGEEQGLVGSRDYARKARARGDDIRAVWNMDMIGYVGGGPADSILYYKDDSSWMYEAAGRAARLYVPELTFLGENNAFRANSDHYSFWQEGYPATYLHENPGNGVYPHYHKETDTVDKLSIPFVASNARLAVAAVAGWARLRGGGPALALGDVRVYPNPYKPDRHGGGGVTFDRVPSDASLAIYSLAGELVAEGRPDSGGRWRWPAAVASGVFFYVVERDGERVTGKVAVVK
ncbi:MAG: M20/M25/M40 family metallo-hydrolase [Candidatus Coatesbacteria bacterium]|nr:MAG: M20/M25/M40 family metallo-hydrolase [Candidatus Coatesbacteria bacterium]